MGIELGKVGVWLPFTKLGPELAVRLEELGYL